MISPQPLDVLVFRGAWWNPVTAIIYTRTSTLYTHCAIVVGDGVIAEAVASGVKLTYLSHYKDRPYKVMRYDGDFTKEQLKDALDFIYWIIETAEGYDFAALLGFLMGIKRFNSPFRWYCSEIPVYVFLHLGISLYREVPAFIYPSAYVQHCDFKEITL